MTRTTARLTAWSLTAGSVLATAGYLAAFLANGGGDERYTGATWTTFYTVALFGNVLVLLGLPALIHAQQGRAQTLTRIGYVGLFVPLVVLNVGEGVIEAFAKPYLARNGGLPTDDLPGLGLFEAPALLLMLVGMICLAVAVFRGGVLPRWVGAAFLFSLLLGLAGTGLLTGAASLASDYVLFAALVGVGLRVVRMTQHADAVPVAARAAGQQPSPVDAAALDS